jgi:hypothetical protein
MKNDIYKNNQSEIITAACNTKQILVGMVPNLGRSAHACGSAGAPNQLEVATVLQNQRTSERENWAIPKYDCSDHLLTILI